MQFALVRDRTDQWQLLYQALITERVVGRDDGLRYQWLEQ